MRIRLALLPVAALLLSLALPASAQELYRWKDDKGVVHYSDKKPEGVTAEKREYKAQDLPSSRLPGSQNVPAEGSEGQSDAAAPDPAEAAAACARAEENLRVLRVSPQVSMDLDGDGEPELIDEDTRQAMIARYEASRDRLCADVAAVDGAE